MKKIKINIPAVIWVLAFSIIGFVIGILTMAFYRENWFLEEGILNQELILQAKTLDVDKRALFFLCLGRRMRAFFLLYIFSFSSVNLIVSSVFFLVCGIYAGSILEILVMHYGLQGMGMYFTMIFPQGIFYVMGFCILGCWCWKQERLTDTLKYKKVEKIKNASNKKAVCVALLFVFTGIILESFINPKIFFCFI